MKWGVPQRSFPVERGDRDEIDDQERDVVARHGAVVQPREEPVGELLARAFAERPRALGEPSQPGVDQLGLSLHEAVGEEDEA